MKYLLNVCFNCKTETSNPKFCSSSCAASYNNKNRNPRTKESRQKTSESMKRLGIKPPPSKKGRRWAKPPDETWESYKKQTGFYLTKDMIHLVKGYDLFLNFGMYHHKNNPGGVVKDHRLSKKEGYELGLSHEIIKHPANCEFMLHSDNNQKSKKSSITPEQLIQLIKEWTS